MARNTRATQATGTTLGAQNGTQGASSTEGQSLVHVPETQESAPETQVERPGQGRTPRDPDEIVWDTEDEGRQGVKTGETEDLSDHTRRSRGYGSRDPCCFGFISYTTGFFVC